MVLQKAGLSDEADPENKLGGSSETMYYIGLDERSHRGDSSLVLEAAFGCLVLLETQGPSAERHTRVTIDPDRSSARSQERAVRPRVFS